MLVVPSEVWGESEGTPVMWLEVASLIPGHGQDRVPGG